MVPIIFVVLLHVMVQVAFARARSLNVFRAAYGFQVPVKGAADLPCTRHSTKGAINVLHEANAPQPPMNDAGPQGGGPRTSTTPRHKHMADHPPARPQIKRHSTSAALSSPTTPHAPHSRTVRMDPKSGACQCESRTMYNRRWNIQQTSPVSRAIQKAMTGIGFLGGIPETYTEARVVCTRPCLPALPVGGRRCSLVRC